MAVAGSQNSGVIVASAAVYKDPCRLVSLQVANTDGGLPATVEVYDSATGASGKLVAVMLIPPLDCREYDLHGAKMLNGVWLEIIGDVGTVKTSVCFA